MLVLLTLAIVFFVGSAGADGPRSDRLPLLFVGNVLIVLTVILFFIIFFPMGLMIIKAKERYRAKCGEHKDALDKLAVCRKQLEAQVQAVVEFTARVAKLEFSLVGSNSKLADILPASSEAKATDEVLEEKKPTYTT